jgi:hypothetical protein
VEEAEVLTNPAVPGWLPVLFEVPQAGIHDLLHAEELLREEALHGFESVDHVGAEIVDAPVEIVQTVVIGQNADQVAG